MSVRDRVKQEDEITNEDETRAGMIVKVRIRIM